MAGVFNSSIFNNSIFNTGDVVAAATEVGGLGNWDSLRKSPKKKRKKGGTVIRRSDFASLEAYHAALQTALTIPMSEIQLEGNVIGDENDEEDVDAILLAVSRMVIH